MGYLELKPPLEPKFLGPEAPSISGHFMAGKMSFSRFLKACFLISPHFQSEKNTFPFLMLPIFGPAYA